MSNDPDQEPFCDGLSEELIDALARLEGLCVVARTSAFQFRGKGHDLREVGEKLKVKTCWKAVSARLGTAFASTRSSLTRRTGITSGLSDMTVTWTMCSRCRTR